MFSWWWAPVRPLCLLWIAILTSDDDLGRTFILPYGTFFSADASKLLIPINGLLHVAWSKAFTAAPRAYGQIVRTRKTSRPYKTLSRHVSKWLLFILLLCSTKEQWRDILFQFNAEFLPSSRLLVSALVVYATTFRPMFPWWVRGGNTGYIAVCSLRSLSLTFLRPATMYCPVLSISCVSRKHTMPHKPPGMMGLWELVEGHLG